MISPPMFAVVDDISIRALVGASRNVGVSIFETSHGIQLAHCKARKRWEDRANDSVAYARSCL